MTAIDCAMHVANFAMDRDNNDTIHTLPCTHTAFKSIALIDPALVQRHVDRAVNEPRCSMLSPEITYHTALVVLPLLYRGVSLAYYYARLGLLWLPSLIRMRYDRIRSDVPHPRRQHAVQLGRAVQSSR